MTNAATDDGRFGGRYYDEVILLDENDEAVVLGAGRTHEPITPAQLAVWETAIFPALRRLHEAATSTPVDDELPEQPQNHLDEARAALARFPSA